MVDLAALLRELADRVDTLDTAQRLGALETLKERVRLAATPAPPAVVSADPYALLTDEAVGEVLGVPARSVVLLRQRGLLPGVPVGDKYVRTRRRDLERYVDSLPSALYSRKYAHSPDARPAAGPDAGRDDAPPPSPSRLDASRARPRARRHGE
jgi:hypothetical protein